MSHRLILDPIALRRARLQRALSQRALAEAAGIREATVTAAEQGSLCRLTTIKRLATALNVEPTAIAKIVAN